MPEHAPALVAAKNRSDKAFIVLVEIEYADGEFWRVARLDGLRDTTVEFEGHTWSGFPIGNVRRPRNSRGEIATFELPIANPERIFQSILATYIVEGRTGRIITVHPDHLDDPTARVVEWFTIESASSHAKQISLTCKSVRHNPRRTRIPSKTMTRAEYPGLLGANRARFY